MEEVGFIAYYFHWGHDAILNMEHRDRIKWCDEISAINKAKTQEPERNIFDI